MPPPIAELTARAQTLTSAGDLVGARKVLAPALEPSDTDPQHASPDLAVAAALHARILIALGEPHAARIWAGYAHAAEEHLHGPHDERTINAAATHAAVLARIGNHGQAAQLYHDLVLELTALDGRESQRVLAAEADLATAEHAAGQCTAARSRLAEVWARHRRVYGDPAPAGIKMLARLGAMDRECGRHTESRKHLDLAQELCARHLPGDHPLAAQIAKLAAAPASGRHTCGRVRQSAGPEPDAPGPHAVPRRSTPSPDEPTPGVYAVPPRSAPAPHEPAAQQSAPRPHAPAPGVPDMRPEPYGSDPPQALRPEMPPPDDRITDPQGAIYQQPLYLSDLNQPPGEPVGRHARADTPPPLPGQRVPEYTADGHLVPIGSAPVRADQRLPVPREKPEPASSRGAFVLAAVIVAGVGVAAAVVAATLPRGEARPPAPTTSATPPAATASSRAPAPGTGGGDAPAGVRLRDNRDNVTLTWTYPKGSEGPVLVSGGRSGEPQRAFQQLPAGTSDYVVYGLNEQLDYCFTVAVVHSTDKVSPSQVVCTARR